MMYITLSELILLITLLVSVATASFTLATYISKNKKK